MLWCIELSRLESQREEEGIDLEDILQPGSEKIRFWTGNDQTSSDISSPFDGIGCRASLSPGFTDGENALLFDILDHVSFAETHTMSGQRLISEKQVIERTHERLRGHLDRKSTRL